MKTKLKIAYVIAALTGLAVGWSIPSYASGIDAYPAATALDGTERVPGNQGAASCTGCTVKITPAQVNTYVASLVHTWPLVQTFTVAPVFTDASGTRTALGLGALSTVTPGTGVATWATTPSSANFAAAITDETGTGVVVLATSPTLVTPVLGVATATSINGNTFTTGTYTLTGVAGKTLTFNKSLTLEGTDSTTQTFPTTSATIARTDAAQSFTGLQTFSTGNSVASGQTRDWNSDTFLGRRAAAGVMFGAADAASPVAQTISVQGARGGTDTNTAAVSTTVQGSLGTGTGATGDIVFKVGTPQTTGTTAHVAATVLTVHDAGTAATQAGQILVPNVLQYSTPEYSFSGDPDTGLGYRSSNAFSFVAGGVEEARITAQGLTIITGGLRGPSNILYSITAPTIASGLCTSPAVSANNGTGAFALTVGTSCSGIQTGTLTMPAATTGWVCYFADVTTPASFVPSQTGGSTTTVTFTNYSRTTGLATDFTASDSIRVLCSGY